jgi:hypothetical protein
MIRRFIEDLLCKGDFVQLTSPSGSVEIIICDGWCKRWDIRVHDAHAEGHGVRALKRRLVEIPSTSVAYDEICDLLESQELSGDHA